MRAVDVSNLPQAPAPTGAVPMLEWVSVQRLVLDDRYQRPLGKSNWAQIRTIAEAFSWSRFSPLLLAPVEGGSYAIVDGQHRAHAAALCGIETVPAMIVLMDAREQASAFSWVNGQVTRVTPLQMYRAALAAGEPWAERCDRIVAGAGCRLMTSNRSSAEKKPYEIYAVAMVRKAVLRGHAKALSAALSAWRRFDEKGRVALWSEFALGPWVAACIATPAARVVDLVGVLAARDPFKVMTDAEQATGAGGTFSRARDSYIARINASVIKGERT